MTFAAALIYGVIVALWAAVLIAVGIGFSRHAPRSGATRLLLSVVALDSIRHIVENIYFGASFGAPYRLLPEAVADVLGNSAYLSIPMLLDILAGGSVAGLLLLYWLPAAARERSDSDDGLREVVDALRQESEERRHLFETSNDLIMITDRRGTFLRVSPSSVNTLGYFPDEMIGRKAVEFIDPVDLEAARIKMASARAGERIRDFESRFLHRDGRTVMLAWSGVWSESEQKYFFIGRDITKRLASEEQLKRLAHFDQLTGLPNRVSLRQDLSALIEADIVAGRVKAIATTIAMFDLDGFKDINDTLGHTIGDLLLQEVARRLGRLAGDGARVYRLGGDEFVVICPECGTRDQIAAAIAPVLKGLAELFEAKGQRLFIGASAGIAVAPCDGANVEDLIANADLALYAAKAAGGNTFRFFVPELRAKAQARRALDLELRRAYLNSEFELYYQPQVCLADGMVVGAEALLRWRHPQRGVLSPGDFIEVLSASALAQDVGNWVLRTACDQAALWREQGLPAIRMGVNLFPAQFHNGTLFADVAEALAESGLPAEALELEITENIALDSEEAMLAPLLALRDIDVGIAFDDFGTGYASLIYLTRFPLSRIKIDQSFLKKIQGIDKTEDTAIVRSVITMAHNLGLEVIAEGVETAGQAAFLQAQGCEEVQGYFYAQPLPAPEFAQFLKANAARAGQLPPMQDRLFG
ncbi:MAG: EAL domain-containing protein [Rhodopseudomonas sp.]|nr:EAL domain-containing protein [Rhodopseudomonas sp.]